LLFRKINKCDIVINEQIIIARIGERGVMKTKIVSLAMVLGLFAFLGGCDTGTGGGGTGGETSPSLLSHLLWRHLPSLSISISERRVARWNAAPYTLHNQFSPSKTESLEYWQWTVVH